MERANRDAEERPYLVDKRLVTQLMVRDPLATMMTVGTPIGPVPCRPGPDRPLARHRCRNGRGISRTATCWRR